MYEMCCTNKFAFNAIHSVGCRYVFGERVPEGEDDPITPGPVLCPGWQGQEGAIRGRGKRCI